MEANDQIVRAVEAMPELPGTVKGLLAMDCAGQCGAVEFVETLGRDPVFSLKLLRLVNSRFCEKNDDAASLQRAAVFLGTRTLHNLAVGLACVGAFPAGGIRGVEAGEFWLHSLATGVCARLLAERMGASVEEGTEYFLAGVLHDIGKLVMVGPSEAEYSRVLRMASEPGCALVDAEVEVFNMGHPEVGAMLARKWNLSPEVAEAVRCHHVPSASSGDLMTLCVHAGNEIAKMLSFGSAGDFEVRGLPPVVEKRFGMSLKELADDLGDLDAEVDRARIFIKLAEAGA